jgi:hypothetical protein
MNWLLLLQVSSPTVGDTIWLERRVEAPAGAEVRAAPWTPSGSIELLGRAVVQRDGGTVVVRYPAVAWTPGTHDISVPGPVLVRSDGRTDSLPPQTFQIEVRSVLPPGSPDSILEIQPGAGPVLRPVSSYWPLVGAVGITALLVWLLTRWWRRAGPPLGQPAPPDAATPAPVERWVASGEGRAVAAAAVEHLRRAIARRLPEAHTGLDLERCLTVLAERVPAWPHAELGELLRALDMARFAPRTSADAEELYGRALALGARLPGRAP